MLKYRLRQQQPGAANAGGPPPTGAARQELTIVKGNANPAPGDPVLDEVLRMGTADAQQALRLVRKNAAEWHVDPKRVGLMGFSAGGGVSVGAVVANELGASADFLISLYGPGLQDVKVPANATSISPTAAWHCLRNGRRQANRPRSMPTTERRLRYVEARRSRGYVARSPAGLDAVTQAAQSLSPLLLAFALARATARRRSC